MNNRNLKSKKLIVIILITEIILLLGYQANAKKKQQTKTKASIFLKFTTFWGVTASSLSYSVSNSISEDC